MNSSNKAGSEDSGVREAMITLHGDRGEGGAQSEAAQDR